MTDVFIYKLERQLLAITNHILKVVIDSFCTDHFPRITRGPTISPFIKDKRLAFKCEFESDKNEESARFDVTWYEGSPLKKINQTDFLKGLERNATLQNQHEFNGTPLFLLGTTVCTMNI